MGRETGIEWADHTFNPWRGCARVSEGCAACYAEAMARRNPAVLGTWGPDGLRPAAATAYWRQPVRWNEAAWDAGIRRRVFCGSLMDFWEDRADLDDPRGRTLRLAAETLHLDWLLLTKRPANIRPLLSRMRAASGLAGSYPGRPNFVPWWDWLSSQEPPRNWWFGCTVENVRRAEERIPALLAIPARVRFLSVEPLLEPLDLSRWLAAGGIHWVIVGGESDQGGARARPFDLTWAEEIVGQCRAAGVACFVKQLGSRPVVDGLGFRGLGDKHGGDWDEWPDWLRVRELPRI